MDGRGKCLIVAVVGLVMMSAVAQADPVEQLMKLEGTWEVDLGATGGGKQATCVGTKIGGGKGIYTVFKRVMEKDTYSAHAIWTFDPETRKVYVYELNSYGDVFEHTGNFGKDGKLRLAYKAQLDTDSNTRQIAAGAYDFTTWTFGDITSNVSSRASRRSFGSAMHPSVSSRGRCPLRRSMPWTQMP